MDETITDLLYSDDTGKFKLPRSIISQLRQFAQVEKIQGEAGGLLLGRLVVGSGDTVVDEITTPQPTDWSSRFRFRRGSQGHQQILNDRWQQSDGTCNYLGEWHTHPEPVPQPSGRDTHSWQKQLKTLPADRHELYFVIVGTVSITVWKATQSPFSYHQLKLNE